MADDTTNAIIVALVFVMIVVTWLELRTLRRKSKARRQKVARRPEELQDEAHNALVTTKAIASALADRGGIRSEEADSLLAEAQMAYNRRNYRVTIDLTTKVKERLVALRAQQAAHGDLARLDAASGDPATEEPTTKELLQKEYPANLIPSKFAISMAESSIETGAAEGRDVAQARALLEHARTRFEAKDYASALSAARQSEKVAKGEPPAVNVPPVSAPASSAPSPEVPTPAAPSPAAVPVGSACPSCGASLKPDDTFCRKCGTRAVLTNCPNCGASLQADDAFCRKCGTRLQR